MSTGLVYDDRYLEHKQIQHHPECPERLMLTLEHFYRTHFIDSFEQIKPFSADDADLERVHASEHINYIRCLSEKGMGKFSVIDSDTYVCEKTYEVAKLSAGGVMAAGEAVWKGDVSNCYALTRPPGHHASFNQATGFCYFDNTAVMIRYLQEKHGLKKAFIFDWDAHAPNGTMGTFYDDPSVLNMSIHQDPHSFYPGTGFVNQIGEHKGKGYTINFPVPGGTGDPDYLYFIDEFVIPRVKKFKPELIVVAAGQDSHISDLVSRLNVTDEGYVAMTQRLMKLADELCGGKLVLELEGGYNLRTFPQSNYRISNALLGLEKEPQIIGEVLQSTKDLLDELQDQLKTTSIWGDAPEYGESEQVLGEKQKCDIKKS